MLTIIQNERTLSETQGGRKLATTISARARVRARNQITIPDRIVQTADIEEGETLVVELDPNRPDVLHLRRVRGSYAGATRGLYGETRTYLEEERRDW
jgi:bifunctional DNA-binding transcriptional regulator/antitoxin component of YhaV-PrlF toxin-antitoxin module